MSKRRQRILDAAEELLKHYGPLKTTIADIARHAKVGVGTVYLEFSSKDAILEILSGSRHGTILEMMEAALDNTDKMPAERLGDFFKARTLGFLEHASQGLHGAELVHCACPGVADAHSAFLKREEALLVEFLSLYSASGDFAPLDPHATTRALLRAYATFSPPWVFKCDRQSVEADLETLHGILTRGLLARSKSA